MEQLLAEMGVLGRDYELLPPPPQPTRSHIKHKIQTWLFSPRSKVNWWLTFSFIHRISPKDYKIKLLIDGNLHRG